RSAMQKIIKIGQCCVRKGPLQKKLAHYCGLKNIPMLKMVKRVPTCWNTMYNVVDHVVKLRKALNAITKLPEYNTGRPTQQLKHFFPDDADWAILAALLPILKILYDATNCISTSQYPMLHEVIPMMDILNCTLEESFNYETLPLVIHRGVQHTLVVLDKCYSKVDYSLMWKTAMCVLLSLLKRFLTKLL
ncbi:hypothetical protein BT96DRAFT_836722, partial [Gymnopus androsaceus JB14]